VLKRLNEWFKKRNPILLRVFLGEIFVIMLGILFVRLYMPTVFMDDEETLMYVVELDDEKQEAYMERVFRSENERLVELLVSYYVADGIENDTFDSIDTGEDLDTSGKSAEEYLEEIEETENNTYPLSDGSGYVVLNGDETKVYDNDGNEIDPETVMNEDGVIEMEFY